MTEQDAPRDRSVVPDRAPTGQRVRRRGAGRAVPVRRGRRVPAAAGEGGLPAPGPGGPAALRREARGCQPLSRRCRRTRAARPRSRCSATPSGTTSAARWPRTATATRWSTGAAAAASPTPSSATRSRRWPPGWSTPASARATGSASGRRTGAEWTALQYATAEIGAILVNINPAYRTHELEYVLKQAGITLLVAAPDFKTSDYRAMVDEVRDDCPDLRAVVFFGDPDWDALLTRGDRGGLAAIAGRAVLRRPDQHPVHQRDHRLPQGRDAVAPQHPQQRLLRRRALLVHRGRPDLHPGALLPLLRHGDGQPRGHLARRLHGHPGARLRPRGDPARRWRRSGARRCTACPPCSSPSWPTSPSAPTTCPRCGPGSWPARRARSR